MIFLLINFVALACGIVSTYYESKGSRKFLIWNCINAPLMIIINIFYLRFYVESLRLVYDVIISFYAFKIWGSREVKHDSDVAHTMLFNKSQKLKFTISFLSSILIAFVLSAWIQKGNDNILWTIFVDTVLSVSAFWALTLTPNKYMVTQYLWILICAIYVIYLLTAFETYFNKDLASALLITTLLATRVYYFVISVFAVANWSKQINHYSIVD